MLLSLLFLTRAVAQTCMSAIAQGGTNYGVFPSSSEVQAFCTNVPPSPPRSSASQLSRHQVAPGHRLTLTATAWAIVSSSAYGVVYTATAGASVSTAAFCQLSGVSELFANQSGAVIPPPGSWHSNYGAQLGICFYSQDSASGINYTITAAACPAGSFCPTNAASPSACAAGTYSVAGATLCAFTESSCPAGTFASPPSSCIACAAGTFSAGGVSPCSSCAAGAYSAAGAASCTFANTSCPAGTYASAPASCLACAAGKFSAGGTSSCFACAAGKFSTGGASSCLCPAGTYSPTCTDCPLQTYASQSGAAACSPCPPGLFTHSTRSTSCDSCGAGFYAKLEDSPLGLGAVCAACRNPSLCPASGCVAGNTGDECRFCIPGYYRLPSGFCAPCGSNFFAYALALFFFLAALGGLSFALRRRLEPYFAFFSRLRKRSAFSLTLLFDQLVRLALLHRLSLIPFPTSFSSVLGFVNTSVGLNLASSECVVRFSFDQQYWVTIAVIFFAITFAFALDCHLSGAGLRVDLGQQLVVAVLDTLLPLAAQPSFAAFAVTQAKFQTGGLISDADVQFSSESHRAVAGFSAAVILFFVSFLGFRSGCAGDCGKKRVIEFEEAAGEEERESATLSRSRTAIALARDWVGFLRMPSILMQMLDTDDQRGRGAWAASVWLLLVSALEIGLFVPARKHFLAERSGSALNAAFLIFVFLFTHTSALACAIRGDGCAGDSALGAVLVALNSLLALLILVPVGSDCWRLWKTPPAQPAPQRAGNVRDFFTPRLMTAGKSPLSASGRHLFVAAFGNTFRPEITTENLAVAGNNPISASGRHITLTAFGTEFITEVNSAVLVSSKPPPRAVEAHCVALLRHGRGGVRALAAMEGGGLASGSESHLHLWADGLDAPLRRIEGRALALAALPGGLLAAGGWGERSVEVWDADSGQRLHQLCGHLGNVNCVAALPGGLFASGGDDKTVRVWEAATGAHVGTLEQPPRFLDNVSFTMRPPMSQVLALAALPSGSLASGSLLTLSPRPWPQEDLPWEGVRVWDVAGRAVSRFLKAGDEDYEKAANFLNAPRALSPFQDVSVFALTAIGGRLAGGCSDGVIYLWSLAGFERDGQLSGHTGSVASLAALPSGLLASGSMDLTVRVWEVGAGSCLAVLRGHRGAVLALAALPDGRLASGAANDPLIRVWSLTIPGSPECAAAEAAAAARKVVAPTELEAGSNTADETAVIAQEATKAPAPPRFDATYGAADAIYHFFRNLICGGFFSCAPDPTFPPAVPLSKTLEQCVLEARMLEARAGAHGWALVTGENGDAFWYHAGMDWSSWTLPEALPKEEGGAGLDAHSAAAPVTPLTAPASAKPASVLLPGPLSASVCHPAISSAGVSAAPALSAASGQPAVATPAAAAVPGPPAGAQAASAAGTSHFKWVQKSGAWIKAATSWRGKGPVAS
jgi:hypothetical protein